MYMILGLSSTAAICWLFSLDQLTMMRSRSITHYRMFAFYRSCMNLWIVGLVLLIISILLFLLLANPIVAAITGVVASLIAVRYWKVNNGW